MDKIDHNSIFATELGAQDFKFEETLRPSSLNEFIGQNYIINNIELMVKSAKIRRQAMDHVLLSGPPGLGKTSLAHIIAREMCCRLHLVSAPSLDKKGDLAATLTNLQNGDILFLDEIHRLNIVLEEMLYSAMEDFRLDIMIGQGATARSMQIDLCAFTLIGATTKAGLLSSPLRDRFMGHLQFDFYKPDDLKIILEKNALKMSVNLNEIAQKQIAMRSRGTPRIVNRILRRVRDYALVNNLMEITEKEVQIALDIMAIDQCGLDLVDRKILKTIERNYAGGPVGIDALCATLNEEKGTIEDVHEPYLLRAGFLLRTPRGRMVSDMAREHLKSIDIR